jgi:hypothetical protein
MMRERCLADQSVRNQIQNNLVTYTSAAYPKKTVGRDKVIQYLRGKDGSSNRITIVADQGTSTSSKHKS